jgi:hypothetical protein
MAITDRNRDAIRERLERSGVLQSICSDGNSDITRVIDAIVADVVIALASSTTLKLRQERRK